MPLEIYNRSAFLNAGLDKNHVKIKIIFYVCGQEFSEETFNFILISTIINKILFFESIKFRY